MNWLVSFCFRLGDCCLNISTNAFCIRMACQKIVTPGIKGLSSVCTKTVV